ncbi:hypothetical protein [Pedobacter cryophilus]|uniref:CcmD family protein n=1 Tax=Pedobacter cryophilus TaxID=2571271 RepID=A0A4U1BXA3_9SPHI|nr:hypothetical protein [Pedobacter cryophilus]TKB96971.1 hypothetical protein FA046_12945 [Pedobacter cryophilus]
MKKISKPTILKSALLFVVLLMSQTATFAQEVYASQALLSNVSAKDRAEESWVWILIGCVFVIAAFALYSARTVENHESAAH